VSGSADHTLILWNILANQPLRRFVGHQNTVWSAISYENILVSASSDQTARVWDLATGQCVHILQCQAQATILGFNSDQSLLVVGCLGGMMTIWNVASG